MDGRQTEGQTDGGDYNIPFAFLKKRGDNQCIMGTIFHSSENNVQLFKYQNILRLE